MLKITETSQKKPTDSERNAIKTSDLAKRIQFSKEIRKKAEHGLFTDRKEYVRIWKKGKNENGRTSEGWKDTCYSGKDTRLVLRMEQGDFYGREKV